jgi:ABC-type antimicrobial peptide transport system permease subunit
MLFLPHAQVDLPSMTIVVRAPRGVSSVAPALRALVRELDPGLPVPSIVDVAASRVETAAGPRFNLSLLGAFAAIAFVLAVTGVYAMLAFAVAERRREMAIRVALGASRHRIAGLILRNGMALMIAGLVGGAAVALGTTRVLSSLLYGVDPMDPLTFAAAGAVLLIGGGLACYLPARQAGRLDAIALLRE